MRTQYWKLQKKLKNQRKEIVTLERTSKKLALRKS